MDEQDSQLDPFAQSLEDKQQALLKRQMELQQSLQQRTNPLFNPTLMKISQALLSPTKSGSFGESLGMGVQALMEGSEQEQLRQQNMLKMQEELEQKKEAVRQGLIRNEMIKKTYQNNPQLGEVLAAFPEAASQILPALFKPSEKTRMLTTQEKINNQLDENSQYQIDANGKISLISGSESSKPGFDDIAIMKTLRMDPLNWKNFTPDDWEKIANYKAALNPEQRARLQIENENLQFNTGKNIPIPAAKSDFFGRVPAPATGAAPSGQTPAQPRAVVAQAPAQPQVTETKQIPIIEQVTPKQKSELLLDKPNQITSAKIVGTSLNKLEQSIDILLKKDSGLEKIVGLSSLAPNRYGKEAANAQTQLETLKSQLAVQAIRDMQDASKTGGAVGQVTNAEWPRLEAQFGNLKQAQDFNSIKKSLENIKQIIADTRERTLSKYEMTYGEDRSLSSYLKGSSKIQFTVPGSEDAFNKHKSRNQ
jgi:hypothetical protein